MRKRAEDDVCANCGAQALEWRRCKHVCAACGTINRSCADLHEERCDVSVARQ